MKFYGKVKKLEKALNTISARIGSRIYIIKVAGAYEYLSKGFRCRWWWHYNTETKHLYATGMAIPVTLVEKEDEYLFFI